MKKKFIAPAVLLFVFGTYACRTQRTDAAQLLNDEKTRQEILSTIVGSHELMLKFIDEVKKSNHAGMMIQHLLSVTQGVSDTQETSKGQTSPYAGQELREIKALSGNEIQKYLNGEGMGQAMAAELNHYPGPRHVMAFASEIHLTDEQTKSTQHAYDVMHEKAVALGKKIVEKETALDKQFAAGTITSQHLNEAVKEIANLRGDLRATHLQAHLGMKQILTANQAAAYDSLRGYSGHSMDNMNHQH